MNQICFLSIVLVSICSIFVKGNVIGIDFASDALKVAIVQPGTPLEIGMIVVFLFILS